MTLRANNTGGTERKRKTIALNMQLLSPNDMLGKQKIASGGNEIGLRESEKQQLDQIKEDSEDDNYSHKFSDESSSKSSSQQ